MEMTRRDILKAGLLGAVGALTGCNTSDITKRAERDFLEAVGLGDKKRQPYNGELISPGNNAAVLEKVYSHFDPSLGSYLRSVPVLKKRDIGTVNKIIAYSQRGAFPYIGVRADWDNPDFNELKKETILTHEFLHLVQDHNKIDPAKFFEAFKRWYLNEEYGDAQKPGVEKRKFFDGNLMKRFIFGDLYEDTEWDGVGSDDEDWRDMAYMPSYRNLSPEPGVEEFAYLGQRIVPYNSDPDSEWAFIPIDRMLEISDELFGYYNGVLNPEILALRGNSIWSPK